MINVGQLKYDKKIVFIYNPSAGKLVDWRQEIKDMMDKHGV